MSNASNKATEKKHTVRAWEDRGEVPGEYFGRASSVRMVATVKLDGARWAYTFYPSGCGIFGGASPVRGTCDTQAEAMSRADDHVACAA